MREQNFMETAIVMKQLQENDIFVDSQAELMLSKFTDVIKSFPSSIKAGKHLRKYTQTSQTRALRGPADLVLPTQLHFHTNTAVQHGFIFI